MLILPLLMLASTPVHAGPFTIQVVTEPAARERAQEFIREVSAREPFRQLIAQRGLVIRPQATVIDDLGCRGGYLGITRLAQCELSRVSDACAGTDFCPVYTAVPTIGAGNQFNPISSVTFPWTTMLHEMVHSFGFTDEYGYTPTEAPVYCGQRDWPNGHWDGDTNQFPSKRSAEAACRRRIPWCAKAIATGTPVTHRRADGSYASGTPTPVTGCPSSDLGVYLGGSCQNMPGQAWRPYFCPSVMGHPELGEDLCEVSRRHLVIARSPDLLPAYYQEVIFNEVVRRKRLRGLRFQATIPGTMNEDFRYGVPNIDRLRHPSGPLPDLCQGEVAKAQPRARGIASPTTSASGCLHK